MQHVGTRLIALADHCYAASDHPGPDARAFENFGHRLLGIGVRLGGVIAD